MTNKWKKVPNLWKNWQISEKKTKDLVKKSHKNSQTCEKIDKKSQTCEKKTQSSDKSDKRMKKVTN